MVHVDAGETPVLVLATDAHWGLGILRSLGRLGIPVYTATSNPRAPAFFSKYCCGRFLASVSEFSKQSLRDLLSIGSKIDRKSILIPTGDEDAS